MKILIVEDDEIIRNELEKMLVSWGYQVLKVENFNTIIDRYREEEPDLVLLDLLLPSRNGFYWCQEIRKESNVPILFISSKSESLDMVIAMQMGADDYITKPFDPNILLAKISAILRRTYDYVDERKQYRIDALRFVPSEMKLRYQEEDITLTRTEALLFEELFQNVGQFVTREALMERCWLGDDYIDDNTLAVNIARMRKKLNTWNLGTWIQTKKGVGYRLEAEDEGHQ